MGKKKSKRGKSKGRKVLITLLISVVLLVSVGFGVYSGFIQQSILGLPVVDRPEGFLIYDDFSSGVVENLVCDGNGCGSPEWSWSGEDWVVKDNSLIFEDLSNPTNPERVGKKSVLYSRDVSGDDFLVGIETYGFAGYSGGGGVTPVFDVSVGLTGTSCRVRVAGDYRLAGEKHKENVLVKVESSYLSDVMRLLVNGVVVCEEVVSGESELFVSVSGNGILYVKLLENPYISIPFGSCPTLSGEVFVVEKFGRSDLDDNEINIGDLSFEPTRFCEEHNPIVITSFGSEEAPSKEVYGELVKSGGVPIRFGEEWVLVYKALKSSVGSGCSDFYSVEFDDCVSVPSGVLVAAPEISFPEDPVGLVNSAEFELVGDERIVYSKRLLSGRSPTFFREETADLMIGDSVLGLSLDLSGCLLPSSQRKGEDLVSDFEGVLSVDISGCAVLNVRLMDGVLVYRNGDGKVRLNDYFDFEGVISGFNRATFGGDSSIAEKWLGDYSISVVLVQRKPLVVVDSFEYPSVVSLNSDRFVSAVYLSGVSGKGGFDVYKSSSGVYPGVEPVSVVSVDLVKGVNSVSVPMDSSDLLGKELKVDNWVETSVGGVVGKFKVGSGFVVKYNVVDGVSGGAMVVKGGVDDSVDSGVSEGSVSVEKVGFFGKIGVWFKGVWAWIIDFFKGVFGG